MTDYRDLTVVSGGFGSKTTSDNGLIGGSGLVAFAIEFKTTAQKSLENLSLFKRPKRQLILF